MKCLKDFIDKAEQTGAKVEWVSTETEEGVQFLNITKGIGAILRWNVKSN